MWPRSPERIRQIAVGRAARWYDLANSIAPQGVTLEGRMPLPSRKELVTRVVAVAGPPLRILVALLPGLGLLGAAEAQGWFSARTSPAPAPAATPSPWSVAPARAASDAACQLSVHVRDAVDGGDIDDAHVSFVRLAAGEIVERIEARANRRGVVRVIDLEPGVWNVTVAVDDRALQGAPDFRCEAAGQRAYFDVAVAPASHVVVGRVANDQRLALPGATVALWQDDRHRGGVAGVVRVGVDDEGRFRAPLPPGDYVAFVSATDHVARRTQLRVRSKETKWATRLTYQPKVRGVVVDETGLPVAGAVVAMGEAWDPNASVARVVADAEGRFALPIVRGQSLKLTARGAGRLGQISLGVVDDVAFLQSVTLGVRAGRTVSGVVVADDGSPRPHGRVHYRVRSLGLEGEVECDGGGRFVLDGMPTDDVEAWAADNATGAWGARVADVSTAHLTLPWTPPAW